MKPTDEQLGAYIDGELDAAARAQLEAALAGDTVLRERLLAFRRADARLQKAFELPGTLPDDPLAARILTAPAAAPLRRRRDALRAYWPLAAGMTGVALGLGLGLGIGSRGVPVERMAGLPADVLDRVLETRVSGAASDDGLRVVLSFRADDGAYCRVFESHAPLTSEGLACRRDGRWRLMAWDATAEVGDDLRPAGGGLIDAAADALGSAAALDAQQERNLIQRHWSD